MHHYEDHIALPLVLCFRLEVEYSRHSNVLGELILILVAMLGDPCSSVCAMNHRLICLQCASISSMNLASNSELNALHLHLHACLSNVSELTKMVSHNCEQS